MKQLGTIQVLKPLSIKSESANLGIGILESKGSAGVCLGVFRFIKEYKLVEDL